MTAKKKAPVGPYRFSRATGAPFSDDDVRVIGVELLRIAEEHRVDDVRSLDSKLVYEIVEADEHHALRRFYDWNDKSAARKHRIAQTGTMIRSVRIEIRAGGTAKAVPCWIGAEAPAKRGDEVRTRRTKVLRDDVLRRDPIFASAVGLQIRAISNALTQLESLVSALPPHDEIAKLCAGLRDAIDAYKSNVDAAAE